MALKPVIRPKTFSIGKFDALSAGGGFPEGDYIASDFTVMLYAAKNRTTGETVGAERLGVMVTFLPLDDPKEESARTQFYSFGGKSHESWAPNPETGKSIVPVPGGKGQPPMNNTNYAIFLKSLYDSGMPDDVFDDDFSVLDGVWVHIANTPEPEERKGFATTSTGEGSGEPRRTNMIPVVTEIKEGGEPWAGGGGVPETEAPVKKGAKPAAKPPVKAAAKPAAKVVEEVEEEAAPEVDEDISDAAKSAITTVLVKNPKGLTRLALRTNVFAAIKKAHDEDVASAVVDAFFAAGSEANLASVLGDLGFEVKGTQVVPA